MATRNLVPKATEILRASHLKVTPQRLEILAYLLAHHNHPTVEKLFSYLESQGSNIGTATIYNTLNTFVDLGLVIQIQNGDGSTHYDYYDHPHFHIICTNCKRIADVDYEGFAKDEQRMRLEAERQTGFITSSSHLEIYGLCASCQRKLHVKKQNQQ